jgi:hypothetical protein
MKFHVYDLLFWKANAGKKIFAALLTSMFIGLAAGHAAAQQPATPGQLAQLQLEAYNSKDIERFLSAYSDSVAVYTFPNRLQYRGIENMRQRYAGFFAREPRVHCEVTARVVHGKTVIDQEKLTGFADSQTRHAVAIYTVEGGKIQRVYFIAE